MRILHLINSLHGGGAQAVLADLVTHWPSAEDEQMVIALLPGGMFEEPLRAAGIRVESISGHTGGVTPGSLVRLTRIVRAFRPDVVQTWLYHTSLIGSLAVRAFSGVPIIWGMHHTLAGRQSLKALTWCAVRLLAALSSRLPAAIICCSSSALRSHAAHGFHAERLMVIENGVDTERFCPGAADRSAVRDELGLGSEKPVIGMLARFHPQKDHRTLIGAAAELLRRRSDVRFVLAGDGADRDNEALVGLLREAGVERAFRLLGPRADVERLYRALDIVTLTSAHGEALPRVIAEGMACGVPCVATDVGDTAELIGEAGAVVPPGEPGNLAQAWEALLALPGAERARLSALARQRIVECYGLPRMLERYRAVYRRYASN